VWKVQTQLLETECWWKPRTIPICHSNGMLPGFKCYPWQVPPLLGPRLHLAKASLLQLRTVTMPFLLQVGFWVFTTTGCKNLPTSSLSVHVRKNLDPLNGFSWNFIFGSFTKIFQHIKILVTVGQQHWTLHMNIYRHFNSTWSATF
jgi:hypothetical protein